MFYQFSIYAPRQDDLTEIADTLVKVWDFDPGSVFIARGYAGPVDRMKRRLRLLMGVRYSTDWHMFITGPKNRQTDIQVGNLVDKFEGECDGGGYDFTYDPTRHYTDDQIYRYDEQWEAERRAQEAAYVRSLTPEQRERHLAAVAELQSLQEAEVATARADREKYGYAE
jgi:hypothetical protein